MNHAMKCNEPSTISTHLELATLGASCKRPADQDPGCRPWPREFQKAAAFRACKKIRGFACAASEESGALHAEKHTKSEATPMDEICSHLIACEKSEGTNVKAISESAGNKSTKLCTVCTKAPLVHLQPLHLRHPPGVPISRGLNVGSNL